jgi:transglutaminase-like putative cysteine protease
MKWQFAWMLIAAYGLLLNVILLGRLSPSVPSIVSGWGASSAHIRQNLALTADRIGGWFEAVYGGGSSKETIVFALGLGLLAWFLAAYAGWSTFRQGRPLAGLTAMGFALAINGYFGNTPLWPAAVFVGLAALLTAVVHYTNIEQGWTDREIDFSTEIRYELLGISGGIALILLAIAFVLPAVRIGSLTQAVFDRPAVHEAEEAFDRAFAGVRQPRTERVQIDLEGKPGRSGTLPRSFLLGAPPELFETVVLTAATSGDVLPATHWRGFSYDVYTGRGWAISTERQEQVGANQDIHAPPAEALQTINQSVHWVQAPLATRYTLGLPERFDQDVIAFWRGLEDLSRVQSRGRDYAAVSRLSGAPAAALRKATLAAVPPEILARYTDLPDTVPARVYELGQQISGDPALSPFDQAEVLERFLRQYPYSLDVELPPAGSDPVDFFLFDLQTGYCDYYASAMVVLARTLGLPARMSAGFLAQPADEMGVQTLYQINAHSWPEIYFAGYGWIEFEPTAPFPTRDTGRAIPIPPGFDREEPVPITHPPPIPEQEFQGISPFWWLLGAVLLVLVSWSSWKWRQKRVARPDGVLWAYGRLLSSAGRLGQPTPPHQTPAEFETALLARLEEPARPGWELKLRQGVQSDIVRLASIFVDRQYRGKAPAVDQARESWQRIRGRMWLLGLLDRLFNKGRMADRKEK